MKCKYAEHGIRNIDLLFNYFSATKLEEELQSHVAKYLTVLISGMYEDIIKHIVKEYIQKEVNALQIENFMNNTIDKSFRNPDHQNLKGFFNRFDKDWMKKLDEKLEGKDIDALDSIVNQKNLIAHGRNSNITLEDIKKYYESSKNIIIEIDSLIL